MWDLVLLCRIIPFLLSSDDKQKRIRVPFNGIEWHRMTFGLSALNGKRNQRLLNGKEWQKKKKLP